MSSTPKPPITPQPAPVALERTFDDIGDEIVAVAKAFQSIGKSKLKKRAILLLIRDSTSPQIGLYQIEQVLNAAQDLAKNYIDPAKL